MSRPVRFTEAARQEIVEAYNWYEQRAAGLGGAFRDEIDRQVARISSTPLQFPVMLADVRRAKLRRFPYGLFFKIADDGVYVIACFHASRDPQTWQDRA